MAGQGTEVAAGSRFPQIQTSARCNSDLTEGAQSARVDVVQVLNTMPLCEGHHIPEPYLPVVGD